MIAHLKGREKAIEEEFGFKPAQAEWIALVALHSGIFLRSQYGRWVGGDGSTGRMRAQRLADILVARGLASDRDLDGLGRMCHVRSRVIYRALGAENIRHRREASHETLLARLLSLECVLREPDLPWLPTEAEKVEAFESLGIEKRSMPKRAYGRRAGGRTARPFAWKMPVAVGEGVARFAYADTGGETQTELLSWGAEHAPLWSALGERDVRVEIVAASLSREWTRGAERVLAKWRERGIEVSAKGMSTAELDELEAAEHALGQLDDNAMARWGGLQGTIDRLGALQIRKRAAGGDASVSARPEAVQARVADIGWNGGLEC